MNPLLMKLRKPVGRSSIYQHVTGFCDISIQKAKSGIMINKLHRVTPFSKRVDLSDWWLTLLSVLLCVTYCLRPFHCFITTLWHWRCIILNCTSKMYKSISLEIIMGFCFCLHPWFIAFIFFARAQMLFISNFFLQHCRNSNTGIFTLLFQDWSAFKEILLSVFRLR